MDSTRGLCKTFPASHEPVSKVVSSVQEEILPQTLSLRREAIATEVKGRISDLCYLEMMKVSL